MHKSTQEKEFNIFDLFILILSCYILLSLLVSAFVQLSEETQILLNYIDNAICVIFLIDFFIRFRNAQNKLQFLKWGWIDLLASIPNLDVLRPGRFLRVFRLLRLLRAAKSTVLVYRFIHTNRSQNALISISLIALLMIIFSSIAILQFENVPAGNIRTAEDALWWSYTTITTVGYGDRFPVTTEGRLIGVGLMTVGVGIFGTYTAIIAAWITGKPKN
jgi:voltage-gated potassium channel